MATYFLDPISGNNSADGLSFANRWKTLSSGINNLGTNDTLKIAASPAPTDLGVTSNWTANSKTVTLSAPVTSGIYSDGAWTAATNVTASTSTTRREGANSSSLVFAAAFVTGRAAFFATPSTLNLSAFSQISFWIRSSLAAPSQTFTLKLCSDALGISGVNSFIIPPTVNASSWMAFTLPASGGGVLGSSIKSVALYADIDPGIPTILLDNIIAVKGENAPDSINLNSLISPTNSEATPWYSIQSINGTTILIDSDTASSTANGQGYHGDTANGTTIFKRETFFSDLVATTTTAVNTIPQSYITIAGGWTTSSNMTVPSGTSWFSGRSGWGRGFFLTGKTFILFQRIGMVRYYVSFYVTSSSSYAEFASCYSTSAEAIGFQFISSNYAAILNSYAINSGINGASLTTCHNNYISQSLFMGNEGDGLNVTSTFLLLLAETNTFKRNVSDGIEMTNCSDWSATGDVITDNNGAYGLRIINCLRNDFKYVASRNNGVSGISISGSVDNIFQRLTTSGNSTSGINVLTLPNGENYVRFWDAAEATEVSGLPSLENSRILSFEHDNTSYDIPSASYLNLNDNFVIFTDGARISSDTTIRRTASGISWRMEITTSTGRSGGTFGNPLKYTIARVAVAANTLVTAKVWLYRTSGNITGGFLLRGNQIAGANSDISSSVSTIGSWQEQTITFTPLVKGVVEFSVVATATNAVSSVYIDDFSVTQV